MIANRMVTVVLLSWIAQTHVAAAPAGPGAKPTIEQKTQALAEKWKAKFGEERFNVLVAPPFVLAGNGTPQQLAGYRDRTVLGAAKALNAQFFKTPLDEPVLILLFETEG